ncbi:MAG TPA: hypothetical protein VII12_02830 [Thermoanaerobaculia bacterium]
MRKATTNDKIERRGRRFLAAASLALTFAAFGCTSTRYGEPTSASPSYGPMNHSVLPGSSYATESDTPMASSYTGISRVNVDALAILAAEQGFRGRVLGPVNPGGVQAGVPIQPTGGQFVSPALIANPQSTVNSSISSQPTPVISSGTTGGGVAIAAATASPAAVATTGTTIGTTATTAGTTGAVAVTGALATTPIAGSAAFSPVLMNSTPAPQATGTANATLPTIGATGRPLASTSSVKTARTTSTTAASKTARVTVASNSTNVAMISGMPIRIEAGTQGQVMVTNVTMSAKPASTKP